MSEPGAMETQVVVAQGRMVVEGGSTPVPVSGALTDTQLRATAVPVSGPLTDTQLRATAVPVTRADTGTAVAGATAAPATSAVLCDTGALAAGVYDIDASMIAEESAGSHRYAMLAHRNAANDADVRVLAYGHAAYYTDGRKVIRNYTIGANERIVWRNGPTVAGSGTNLWWSYIATNKRA